MKWNKKNQKIDWKCKSFGLIDLVRGRQFVPTGLDAPNLTRVLGDGAVAREFARRSDVVDAHLHPHVLILLRQIEKGSTVRITLLVRRLWRPYLVRLVDSLLSGDVSVVIGQAEETIVVHEIVVNVAEFLGVVGAKETGSNLIDHLFNSKGKQSR